MKKNSFLVWAFSALLTFASCDKSLTSLSKGGDSAEPQGCSVSFQVSGIEQVPFAPLQGTRAGGGELADVCTRMGFAIFQNGTKIEMKSQSASDADFGSYKLNLALGDYTLVVVAHSCKSNATIATKIEKDVLKVSFSASSDTLKNTDTFYAIRNFTVSENTTLPVELSRNVAKFTLAVNGDIPQEVKQFKIVAKGGSADFDAITGTGCTNSTQTETFTINPAQTEYSFYTFPREQNGATVQLNVTVEALDAAGNVIKKRTITGAPLNRNKVTKCSSEFFAGDILSYSEGEFAVEINSLWDEGELSCEFDG